MIFVNCWFWELFNVNKNCNITNNMSHLHILVYTCVNSSNIIETVYYVCSYHPCSSPSSPSSLSLSRILYVLVYPLWRHWYFLPPLGRDTCVLSLVCLHWYFLGPQVYDTHFPQLCIVVSIIISWLLQTMTLILSLSCILLLFPFDPYVRHSVISRAWYTWSFPHSSSSLLWCSLIDKI